MPILADVSSPSPSTIGNAVSVIFYLAGGIYFLFAIWQKATGKHGKTEIASAVTVKTDPSSATQDQLKMAVTEWHGRVSRERREIDDQIRRVEAASERRTESLEKKIDDNTRVTERIGGTVEAMNTQMNNLNGAITNFMRDQANRNHSQ